MRHRKSKGSKVTEKPQVVQQITATETRPAQLMPDVIQKFDKKM